MKRARRFGLGTALLVLFWPAAPALAATAATGHYAAWSTGGSSGAYAGTGATGAAGFPVARETSDATTIQVPSGSSAFLRPGNALSAADLGFAGVFNYCAVSPKPSSCSGPGPFTDVPTWHPGTSRAGRQRGGHVRVVRMVPADRRRQIVDVQVHRAVGLLVIRLARRSATPGS